MCRSMSGPRVPDADQSRIPTAVMLAVRVRNEHSSNGLAGHFRCVATNPFALANDQLSVVLALAHSSQRRLVTRIRAIVCMGAGDKAALPVSETLRKL